MVLRRRRRGEQGGQVGDDGVEPPAVEIVEATAGRRRGRVGGARSAARSGRRGGLAATAEGDRRSRRSATPGRVRRSTPAPTVAGSVASASIAARTLVLFRCGHREHGAESVAGSNTSAVAGRVDPQPQVDVARTGAGMASTHSSMNPASARAGSALPARARNPSTSPVSPHTPTNGDSAGLALIGEHASPPCRPVGVHEGGIGVDRQQPPAGLRPSPTPGPASCG